MYKGKGAINKQIYYFPLYHDFILGDIKRKFYGNLVSYPLRVDMTEDQILLVVVVFIAIAGVWLTILSYLVLSKISSKKKEEAKKAEEKETSDEEKKATEED